ncbi:MAG: protease inhibitor I42 family protein [Methanotrichaceae archaeon]
MMNKYALSCTALALAFSLTGIVLATSICDNAPCEKMINASVGKNFTISFDSMSQATGFQWWVNFDPAYVNLVGESFVQNNAAPGMVGVPGMETFTFVPKKTGETDITMLALQPWENGTIGQRKIYPVTITG